MTRDEHLHKAESLRELAIHLRDELAAYDAAGEIVWGATVHAMSAADPEHGSGEHRTPNTARRFNDAARRIANDKLTASDLLDCLENNQGGLHNHYYHGNLSEQALYGCLTMGFDYLIRLTQVAALNLLTASEP